MRSHSLTVAIVLSAVLGSGVLGMVRGTETEACTTLIAGRNTTVDGSILFAKTEDDSPRDIDYLWYVPRRTHEPGAVVQLHAGGTIPQVTETYAYSWDECPGTAYSNTIVNEWGVAFGSNGCASREDPVEGVEARGDLVDGGLGFELRVVLAERAKTAREAVLLAAELLDTYGYNASGRNLNIVGPEEAWQLQMVRGKQYAARRVQEDEVAVIANTFSIREVNMNDPENFICSPRLVEYAIERGWYDPSGGEPFDFAEAYANPEAHVHWVNTRRHWNMCRLLDRGFPITPAEAETGVLPVSVKPDCKLSLRDVMEIFRNHYEGTELGGWQEQGETPHGRDVAAICNLATHRTTVVQQRSWMPAEIGTVTWRLLERPCMSGFVPWYSGVTRIPEPFRRAPESLYETKKDLLDYHFNMAPEAWHVDLEFAGCVFKLLGRLVDADYGETIGGVREAWDRFEHRELELQPAIERTALELYEADPSLAREFLTLYSNALALESLEIAKGLIETCPRTYETHIALGEFYLEGGARKLALRSVGEALESAPDDTTAVKRAEWVRESIQAEESPVTLSRESLSRFAGDYGPRHIFVRDGNLYFRREGGVECRLIPLSGDTFELEGYGQYRVRFMADEAGRVSKLIVLGFGGWREESARDT